MLSACKSQKDEDEDGEHGDEHGDHHAPSVLQASELRLITGALSLREVPLEKISFAKMRLCAVASSQDLASDLIGRIALQGDRRAVIVVNGAVDAGSSSNAMGRRSSTGGARAPKVL